MAEIDQVIGLLDQTLPPVDIVKQEYTEWMQCSPFLYDYLQMWDMEYPVRNIQWILGVQQENKKEYTTQRFYLSTRMPNDSNDCIIQMSMHFPNSLVEVDLKHFNEEGATKSNTLGIDGRLTTEYRLYSPGEVIQMKHCPQKDDLIATTSDAGGIYLFDLSHHPTSPINSEPHPQYHLNAHTGPCRGLDWSMARKECLASGGADHAVCIWDVYSAAAVTLQPTRVYAEQKGSVTAVAWHPHDSNILGVCGDDCNVIFYDTREAHSVLFFQAHAQSVRSLVFNPVERFLFATACDDGTVSFWDQRATTKPLHSLAAHTGAATGLAWSPFNACILASYGVDRRVNLWDISRVGAAKQSDRGFDEPEELLFVHGGHRAAVSGVSWNPNDEWTIASVAEDNSLQMWHPSHSILDATEMQGIAL